MYTIAMNGPAKNALGTELMQWIRSELDRAAGQPVILTGTADAFSAGLNLKELSGLDTEGMRAFLGELDALVEALFRYPGPTGAAVNGHAIAGGAIVALCCDVRIGTPNPRARLGLNEVALGLRFPPRTLEVVRYRLPHHTAETVLLGAGLHAPAEALALGMLDALAEDPVAEATARVEALAKHPADAYAAAKEALRGAVGTPNPEADRVFLEEVLPVWAGEEVRSMILGFLGKRSG